jgi:hypothetical protein
MRRPRTTKEWRHAEDDQEGRPADENLPVVQAALCLAAEMEANWADVKYCSERCRREERDKA